MNRTFLLTLLLMVWTPNRMVVADGEIAVLPSDFVMARAPEFAHWTITYTYDAPATPPVAAKPVVDGAPPPPAPALIKEMSVTKTPKIYHCETSMENWPDLEEWWVNGMELTRAKGQSEYTFTRDGTTNNLALGFQNSDFPDIGWVGSASFTGVETIAGKRCYLFKKQVPLLTDDSPELAGRPSHLPPSLMMDFSVWVDAATRLPVRARIPGRIIDYHFLNPPDSPLSLPSDVATMVTAYQSQVTRMSRPGPPP